MSNRTGWRLGAAPHNHIPIPESTGEGAHMSTTPSPTMRSSRIATARPWSAGMGRSTGCASLASTVPRSSVASSETKLATGRSDDERHRSNPPVPRPYDGAGDHPPHADRCGHRHRHVGGGRRQSWPSARPGRAASPAAPCDVHRRGCRVEPGVRAPPRVWAGPSRCSMWSTVEWPRSGAPMCWSFLLQSP